MRRPLVWTFLLVAGNLLLVQLSWWKALLGLVILMILIPIGFLRQDPIIRKKSGVIWGMLLIVPVIAFFRGSYIEYQNKLVTDHIMIMGQQGEPVSGTGRVKSISESDYFYSIELSNCKIYISTKPQSCGNIILNISKSDSRQNTQVLKQGAKILFEGSGELFEEARNEGNYSEKLYRVGQGCVFKLAKPKITILEHPKVYANVASATRERIKAVFNQYLSQEDSGIAMALVTGDKSGISQEDEEDFYQVGVGHILAISGLHLSILGMGLYKILERWCVPPRIRSLCAMGVTFLFATFTGSAVSALRALIMFGVLLGAGWTGRRYDYFSSMGGAGTFLLLIKPWSIYASSFQYSFLAIMGVGMGQRYMNVHFEKIHPLLKSLIISLCAWLFTMPVTLYYNFQISWVGILLNIIVIPLMTPILLLILWGAVLGGIGLPCGILFRGVARLLDILRLLCRMGTSVPYGSILVGRPSIIRCGIYSVVLLALVGIAIGYRKRLPVCPTPNQKKIARICFIGIHVAIVVVTAFMLHKVNKGTEEEITMLDVGQGDGLYLCDGENNHFFIDGGSSDVSSVGEYRILPFLKSRGIDRIDAWFVSHCDEDHISGLVEVLESGYEVERLYLYEGILQDESYEELVSLAVKYGTQVDYLATGEGIETKGIEILCRNVAIETEDKNQNSLVLRVNYMESGVSALLTGDIDASVEQKLVQQWDFQGISIWKAAHHGSNNSNSSEILEEIKPEISIISCGEDNSYGHPGVEAVQRMKDVGSEILCTMETGQITIRMGKKEMQILIRHF